MQSFDPSGAAALLAAAWRDGRQLDALPEDVRPSTLAEGYAVQDSLIAALAEPVGGWKLGVGSPAALRQFSLTRPLAGRIVASRFHEAGGHVTLPRGGTVTVEFEIAFVLARAVPPGERVTDPLSVIAEIRPTFELVHSRFVNRRAVGWPSFTGDSVGFGALVIGEPISPGAMPEVPGSVEITMDGVPVAKGLTGDELSEPVAAFRYLLAHAAERGETLEQGAIATLGAIGKPFDAAADARIEARFAGAKLSFTLERR